MKLYTFDPAPNPRRLNLFIAHKELKIPSEQIDLRAGQQFSESYRAICPRCIVPTLQVQDGSVLCDVIAIATYLESLFPRRPLLGTTPLSRAQILSWDQYIYSDGLQSVAESLRNRSAAFKDRAVTGAEPIAQVPELDGRGKLRLRNFWRFLDAELDDGREYLAAGQLSMADIDAYVVVGFAGWIKETLPPDLPHLNAWHRRIQAALPAL
jgi:glutathione S-transferase